MQRLLCNRYPSAFLSLHSSLRSNPLTLACHPALGKQQASTMATENKQAEWEQVLKPNVPPYSVYKTLIAKSERDDREYRVIKLENGLEATLVHDAKTERAAASLDVAVGHLFDPDDMPGMAHFCEHLLFLGTEQFPRENEYSEYLTKNGGACNAFTSTTNTNYYFRVSPSALQGALARFAPFFHSPLFSPSATARELKAVDSENKKNIQSDIFRMFQVNKHLSKPNHPWRKFGTGNIESLSHAAKELQKKGLLEENGNKQTTGISASSTPIPSRPDTPASSAPSSTEFEGDGGAVGREIRRRLMEWWQAEYSANRMRLCVIGKESLDELSDTVSTLFSPIINKLVDPLPMINGHPFGPDEMGTIVSAQTIMNVYCLELSFPIPYQAPYWKYQPSSFISHFLGHEGPGSVHSYLKHKGWITALSSGVQQYGRGMGNLRVTIQLTKEGFESISSVMLTVYKYLSLLRSSELSPWYQKEISDLSALNFRYSEKRSPDHYAIAITDHMAYPIPRHLIISGPRVVQPWSLSDPENGGEKEMRKILDMCRVERSRALYMGPKEEFNRVNGAIDWQTEKWYGTQYYVERFDEEFLKEAKGPNDIPELFLPGPNAFIPTNLEVEKREVDTPAKRPYLIKETASSSLWHKKDDRFWIPRATALFSINSPIAYTNPRNATLTRVYAYLVADSLTEFAYDAELTSLNYGFAGTDLGLNVTITGYNDKLHLFAQTVFERARKLVVTQERLNVIKASLKRDWENAFMEQPSNLADSFMTDLLAEKRWPLRERLNEIDSITVEEVQSYFVKLLSEVNIKALVTGNMHKEDAIRLLDIAECELQSNATSARMFERSYIPRKGTDLVWQVAVPNPNESNSALTYHIHIGSRLDKRLRTTAQLLAQLMSDPAYNILRTREQLGYITFCGLIVTPGESELVLRILIQSERSPVYLEERANAFLDEMQGILEEMSGEEFEAHKKGLASKWKEQPKNLNEEASKFWRWIDNGFLEFNHNDTNAELLDDVTKADVLALFKSHVHYSSPTRAKTSLHLASQRPAPTYVSEQAFAIFAQEVKVANRDVDTIGWKDEVFAHGEPLVKQVIAYLLPILEDGVSDEGTVQHFRDRLTTLIEEYPAKTNALGKLRPESRLIEDVRAVRASRKLTDYPVPLVQWGDLPIAKI
ncbi:insulin-degrading enzyme [Irpex rosettiformis]|uniref:Insulin-degrading enzyme n=1 Tax=Irpex rosettiformis TaxID=378272 RepID=A0ACB8UHV3_9APHY|nr:insulin-degrading enzyme [Irpex rosettiformis]